MHTTLHTSRKRDTSTSYGRVRPQDPTYRGSTATCQHASHCSARRSTLQAARCSTGFGAQLHITNSTWLTRRCRCKDRSQSYATVQSWVVVGNVHDFSGVCALNWRADRDGLSPDLRRQKKSAHMPGRSVGGACKGCAQAEQRYRVLRRGRCCWRRR